MPQHKQSRSKERRGIGKILAGNVGRGTVDGFENRTAFPEVCARHQAEPSHQPGAKIGNDVAVEILHHHYVVLIWIHHQLHAGVIHNVLAVSDLRKFFGHGA